MTSMDDLGFIVTRCVTSLVTNKYWQLCYDRIRQYYPDSPIVIIDDSSHCRPDLISEKELTKTTIIQSEYPGRGELLPYIYYLKYKWFPRAMILNDCVFINSLIDLSFIKYKLMWTFDGAVKKENPPSEMHILSQLAEPETLLQLYSGEEWVGCFAGMALIELSYLQEVDSHHDMGRLIGLITDRFTRCRFERVLACLLQAHHPSSTLYGNIFRYMPWGITWDQKESVQHLPIVRVWTGR